MWICPQCQREFKTKNQWHSCVTIPVEDLFINKPDSVKQLYELLVRKCRQFGEIKTDTTKSCIYFVSTHRYLAIKPQRNGLILEFALPQIEDIFPVIKIVKISKYQFVHRIKMDTPEDINDQVLGWIQEAGSLK